jgi:hypothetical protein
VKVRDENDVASINAHGRLQVKVDLVSCPRERSVLPNLGLSSCPHIHSNRAISRQSPYQG